MYDFPSIVFQQQYNKSNKLMKKKREMFYFYLRSITHAIISEADISP